jgi:hypothetical protein
LHKPVGYGSLSRWLADSPESCTPAAALFQTTPSTTLSRLAKELADSVTGRAATIYDAEIHQHTE